MSIPKQDERTPGRFWVENRDGRWQVQMEHRGPGSSFCVAQINHWADDGRALAEQIVNSLNAYTSTEALRSALAAYEKWEADLIGSNEAWYTREREPLELPRFTQALWDRLLEIQAMRNAALSGSPAPSTDWRSMDTARKNGRPVLGLFKQTFAPPCGDHAVERWGGTQIVMRHPGLADDGYDCGWNLINGGCGGFPDEWFEGWMPLPRAPDAARTALAGVTAPSEVDG